MEIFKDYSQRFR